jgi:hypothetical protein
MAKGLLQHERESVIMRINWDVFSLYFVPLIQVKQSRYRPGVAQRVPGS